MQSPIPIPTWYPGLTHEQLVDDPISVELGQATIDALNSGGSGGPGGSTGLTDAQLRASPVPVSQNIALNSGTASSNTTRTVTASDSPDVATLTSIDGKVLTNSQLIDALATTAVQVTGPLTDAQLRATALPVAPNITRGTGTADTNTQRVVLASNSPGVTDLVALNGAVGNQVDSAATSDTGSFSLLSLFKRLLTKHPDLVTGMVPVTATSRVCLGSFRVTCTTASQTLAQLVGGTIPVGAVTCEIQADGGTIRMRQDGTVPTAVIGRRIDDGQEKMVDTNLANVRLISASSVSVFANVVFFDRV